MTNKFILIDFFDVEYKIPIYNSKNTDLFKRSLKLPEIDFVGTFRGNKREIISLKLLSLAKKLIDLSKTQSHTVCDILLCDILVK